MSTETTNAVRQPLGKTRALAHLTGVRFYKLMCVCAPACVNVIIYVYVLYYIWYVCQVIFCDDNKTKIFENCELLWICRKRVIVTKAKYYIRCCWAQQNRLQCTHREGLAKFWVPSIPLSPFYTYFESHRITHGTDQIARTPSLSFSLCLIHLSERQLNYLKISLREKTAYEVAYHLSC